MPRSPFAIGFAIAAPISAVLWAAILSPLYL